MSKNQLSAVVLTGLMVLSLVAVGSAGAVANSAPAADESVGTGAGHHLIETMESSQSTGLENTASSVDANDAADTDTAAGSDASTYVDPALSELDERTQVLIQLENPTVSTASNAEAAVDQLKTQADRTQGPVLDAIRTTEGVEAKNSYWITNVIVADLEPSREVIDRVRTIDGVEAVFKSREVEPPEPVEAEAGAATNASASQTAENVTYGLEQINAPDVWKDFGVRGAGATVAVLDTGVDPTHPDIDLYTEDPNDPTYPGGYAAWDYEGQPMQGVEPKSGPAEDPGHGDHTSATATGGDASGTAIGVAPEARLIHGDVFRAPNGTDATVIAAIEWAVENDADAASMSLGFGCTDPFTPEPAYIDSLLEPIQNANDAGTAMVVSTGNAGEGCVGTPGSHWNTLGIGATDDQRNVPFFSSGSQIQSDSWGDEAGLTDDWPDTFVQPDVVAPGDGVLSAGPNGEGYVELSGTSMAAPHVSGAVALIRSFNPDVSVDEIEAALIETAEKPDSWVGPRDERDTRYGMGIVDVREAISEIDAEITLGDVAADDSVDLDDVTSIERAAAGLEPDGFFLPNRADLDRDGEVSISDAILAQRLATDSLEPASLNVTDFSGPTEIDGNRTVEMTATIENSDAMGALRYVEFRVDDSGELGEETAVDHQFLDIAGANVDDPRSNGPVTDVTFELDTSELRGQDYNVGIFSDADSDEELVTVRKPEFTIQSVDASGEVDLGETLSVDVQIENTGNDVGEKNVSYELVDSIGDTAATAVETGVELAPGETQTVTYEIDTSGLQGGEFTQTLSTPDDERSIGLTINEANMAVTEVDGPSELFANETDYTVNATIQNIGQAPETQTVNYALSDLDVAVVDVNHADAHGGEIVDVLSDDPRYDVEVLYPSAIPNAMDDYDAFVVQQFGNDDVADSFLNNLENQGVVYLDSFQGASNGEWADGVYRLSQVRENPDTHREVSTESDGDAAELSIGTDHPIFAGVGDVGETVEMYNDTSSDNTWGSWFEGYDGEQLASIDYGNGYSGPSVAVSEPRDEVLLTAAGRSGYTQPDSFTEESNRLLENAVEYVLTGDVSADRLSPIATDATAVASETVELAPGGSTEVSFEHAVPSDHPTGDSLHAVWTEDSVAGADVTVLEDDYFEIANVDAPETANQTETITVSATVENGGLTNGTQDVEFYFDGSVVDTKEDVSLDAGESTTLDFEYTIDDYQEPARTLFAVRSDMGEHEGVIEVLEIDDANFDVTIADATGSVGQFENVTVNATVENVGDRTATQSLTYSYNPSLDVAVVDNDPSTHGVDAMATDLDDRFGEQVSVSTLNASDLAAEMDGYDVFVVNHFGESDVGTFLDSLGDDQGAIYLDNWDRDDEEYTNGIDAVSSERVDPGEVASEFQGTSPLYYDLAADHPLFEGVGDAGDEVVIADSRYRAWFDNYNGEALADVRVGASEDGSAVGVNDGENEVLLGAMGLTEYATWSQYDENASVILENAVEHLGVQLVSDGSAKLTSDPIRLEGGENATVEFGTEIPLTADSGEYFHVVESADDSASTPFTVDEEITAVRGTVTDEAGNPITGATVSISGDANAEAETDQNGEYFVELEPGDYVVDADAEGYRTNDIVSLEAGDVVTVDHVLAEVAGDITGTVTDENGDPIEGAVVSDADGNAFEVETDQNGEYVIEDVAAGTYALEASAEGYATSDIAFVDHSKESAGTQDFSLTALTSIELQLEETTLNAGESTAATVTAALSDGSEVEVTDGAEITSNETSVASAADGTISTESEGTAELTAEYAGETHSVNLTVEPPVLESIDLSLDEPTVVESSETTATVIGHYSDGSQVDVTGEATIDSANTSVATVTGATVDAVNVGEVTIEAEFENETDATTLTVEASGTTVAVVDDDPSSHGVTALADTLETRLEDEDPVVVETLVADNLLGNVSEYDAFVVNHFGSTNASDFLDALDGEQGTVYIDNDQEEANSIAELVDARDDPQSISSGYETGDITYEITADHAIFDGVGTTGDFVDIHADYGYLTFDGYSGTVYATVGSDKTQNGPAVGTNDSANEVLLGGLGLSSWAYYDEFYGAADTILANSVAHVSDAQAVPDDVRSVSMELDDTQILDDEDETATTVTASFEFSEDSEVTEAATLTSTNETVATVADDGTITGHEPGETVIEAEYEGETASTTLTVIAAAEVTVDITDTTAPVEEGDALEVNATVENIGDEDASFHDVELFDYEGTSVDDTSVDLQGGETQTVTLTWDTGADAGTRTVTVESEDHNDTAEVEITEQTGTANVAVVDDDPTTHGVDDLVVNLNTQLENDFAETVRANHLLGNVSEYDVIVVNHFGSTNASDFLDALGPDQGTVYIDQGYDDGSNAIQELATVRSDIETVTESSHGSPTYYEVLSDHAVFDGLGTSGDEIDVRDSGNYLFFDTYGGDTVSAVGAGIFSADEFGVGVDDNRSEVLLSAHGLNADNTYADYTADGLALVTNSVEYVNGTDTAAQSAIGTETTSTATAVAGE